MGIFENFKEKEKEILRLFADETATREYLVREDLRSTSSKAASTAARFLLVYGKNPERYEGTTPGAFVETSRLFSLASPSRCGADKNNAAELLNIFKNLYSGGILTLSAAASSISSVLEAVASELPKHGISNDEELHAATPFFEIINSVLDDGVLRELFFAAVEDSNGPYEDFPLPVFVLQTRALDVLLYLESYEGMDELFMKTICRAAAFLLRAGLGGFASLDESLVLYFKADTGNDAPSAKDLKDGVRVKFVLTAVLEELFHILKKEIDDVVEEAYEARSQEAVRNAETVLSRADSFLREENLAGAASSIALESWNFMSRYARERLFFIASEVSKAEEPTI